MKNYLIDEFLQQGLPVFNKLSELPNISPQHILTITNNCFCCERHNINKPKTLIKWNELHTSNLSDKEKLNLCKCDCRHTARFICRKYYQEKSNTLSYINYYNFYKFLIFTFTIFIIFRIYIHFFFK